MDWSKMQLRRLFSAQIAGTWGSDSDQGEVAVACVRGTDFDYSRMRVGLDRCPQRGMSRAEFEKRRLRPGDIVLEKSGGGETQPVGRAVLFTEVVDAVPTNFAALLRTRPGVEPRFVTYLLASLWATGATRATINQTTGIQNLDSDLFFSIRVRVPDVHVQRAIADYLDAETARVDALIEKKRRMIELLEERGMSVMTEGVAGLLTGLPQKVSSLRWLPTISEHWREVRLRLVARLGSGHTPSRSRHEWWVDCSIPWITTGEVARLRSDHDEYIYDTREQISELGLANSSAELHPAGTVVLCRTASAGYSGIMATDMATSQDFATWTCGPALRPRFLLLCLRAMRQDLLGRLAMGSTHQTIYMPDIESLRIPLPDLEEQDRVVDAVWRRLGQIGSASRDLELQLSLITERRQALITAAVIGELPIPGVAA